MITNQEGQHVGTGEAVRPPIGQWALVWRRFRRHRLAVVGAWVLLALIALSIVGPFFAPPFQPYHSLQDLNLAPTLRPFNWYRLLGTDASGTGVTTYLLAGGKATLTIGVLGAIIAAVVGLLIGAVAGYFGRGVDTVLMRLTDAVLAVPFLPFLLLLQNYLTNRGIITFAVLFGLVGWAGVARLIRGYFLSLRQREYADAARALGASDLRIMMRHLLPNTLDILVISTTLNIALFILTEASLEFLAAGPNVPTWGLGLAIGREGLISDQWSPIVFAGSVLLLSVLAINLLGDGLRDAFDVTGSGALIHWPAREEPGRLGRLLRILLRPAGKAAVPAAAGLARSWRVAAPGRRLDAIQNGLDRRLAALPWRTSSLPWPLRIAPPLFILPAAMVVALYSHSPLRYAPHFTAPHTIALAEERAEYGAQPLPDGHWQLLLVGTGGRLVTAQSAPRPAQRPLAAAPPDAQPTLATTRSYSLGAWIDANGRLRLTDVRSGQVRTLTTDGIAEHPDAVATHGGVDILFDWEPPGSSVFQLYLARVSGGVRGHVMLRHLYQARSYAYYPRAATDGSGALTVLWLDRTQPGVWAIRRARLTPAGRPLRPVITLGRAEYYGTNPDGSHNLNLIPPQWALDVVRTPDGGTLAGWEGTEDGVEALYAARWDRRGRFVLPPISVVQSGFDTGTNVVHALAVVPVGGGGQFYYAGPNTDGGEGAVTYMQAFDASAKLIGSPQRVAYDGGGSAANPQAAIVAGHPVVLWQRVESGPAAIEEATYHANATQPSLLVRLGLNVGRPLVNVVFVLVGALAGGIGVAVANVPLFVLLFLLWLPAGRLAPRRLRRPLFAVLCGLVLALVLRTVPPAWVVAVPALGAVGCWVAAGGGTVLALWAGAVPFRRAEPPFRAAGMTIAALAVAGVMAAAILIQGEITRI